MPSKIINRILLAYIFLTIGYMIYVYGFIVGANGDNVEHLHVSWLISQGEIPYKDFFQHHNPLLWYIFAPLVSILISNEAIFSIFNSISILTIGLMIYYQIKILLYNKTNQTAAFILGAIEISSYSIMWALNYRPDTFMLLFLFMGIYYFLCHLNDQKLQSLVFSFLCFFIGFMFTQKLLLNMVVIGPIVIFYLLKKKILKTNFILACILPLLLLGLFLTYLYSRGILDVYWQSNYIFNSYIPDIFYQDSITFPPLEYYEFYIFIPLGGISSLYFLYKGTTTEKIISSLFIEEFLLRSFYFSAFLHYRILELILSMMITIMFLEKQHRYNNFFILISGVYLLFSIGYNHINTYNTENQKRLYMHGYEYYFNNLTPCDYALNGYYAVDNLKAKDLGYYSVLIGQLDVLGEKIGIAPRDNLEELIRTRKPKIISSKIYWDTYLQQRGKLYPAHQINMNMLKQYYEPLPNTTLLILKPEYQKYNCQYNGRKWEYID